MKKFMIVAALMFVAGGASAQVSIPAEGAEPAPGPAVVATDTAVRERVWPDFQRNPVCQSAACHVAREYDFESFVAVVRGAVLRRLQFPVRKLQKRENQSEYRNGGCKPNAPLLILGNHSLR